MFRRATSKDQRRSLPATIKGQIGTEANTRFLRTLPVFRVDPKLPEEIHDILDDLERAEIHAPESKR
jgi:hypothetical protein